MDLNIVNPATGEVVGRATVPDDAIKGKFTERTKGIETRPGSGGRPYAKGGAFYLKVGKAQIGRPDKPMPCAVWPAGK